MPKFANPASYTGKQSNQQHTGQARFATSSEAAAGELDDVMISPATLDSAVTSLVPAATETVAGIAELSTAAEALAGVNDTTIMTPAKVALVAIAGAPLASEGSPGIAEIATQAETNTGTDDQRIVTPLKLKTNLTTPPAIGGTTPSTGAFTTLTATAVGAAVAFTSDTSSSFGVTGAGVDLTFSSSGGQVIINGEEAAANAVRVLSAAGGLDVDVALQMNLATSQNAADAIVINASAGGIDITAAGAAGEDIDITNTAGSIRLVAGESAADSIVLSSSIGGIDILAAGASAGEDIDIIATGSSVNINSTENVGDSIVISSTNGGIDILALGAAAGEDIDIIATGSSVNIESTEDAALAVYLHANGGTSETIRLRADQGTGAASIDVLSDVGGITLTAGLASADAINIVASNAAGGIDVDSGTAGFIVDTTGAISLDAAAASNFTATGAFDITVQSTAGSININAGEAASDAINIDAAAGGLDVDVALQMNLDSSQAAATAVRVNASAVTGGIDIDAGSGGITIDTTGTLSLDSAGATNLTATGAFDITVNTTAGSLILTGGEAAIDAIDINASNAAGGIDIDAGSGGITIDTTGVLSLDSQGATNLTATGAFDITVNSTAGSLIFTSGESAADSIKIESTAGGIDILASGAAAGEDIDIVATGSSVNITATENVSDAIVINASGAASGISLDSGTNGITIGTGIKVAVTSVATAASPYAVLGTDYFISTDSTGGALTITLPAAPSTGRTLFIYDGTGQASAGGNITIDGNSKNIAAGGTSAATKVINTAYESYILTYNGTLWCGQNIV
jgi:hypothetical protein